MPDRPWTIDSIAHALPFPELRQNLLREINLTPVERLPEITGRWIRAAEVHQAGRERAEAARDHLAEHGNLPPEHEPTEESQAAFAAWQGTDAGPGGEGHRRVSWTVHICAPTTLTPSPGLPAEAHPPLFEFIEALEQDPCARFRPPSATTTASPARPASARSEPSSCS